MPTALKNKKHYLDYSYALVNTFKQVFKEHTQNLVDKKVSIDAWHSDMKDSLKTLIGLQTITGQANDPELVDWKKANNRLNVQYAYLDQFSKDLTQAIEDDQDITAFLFRSGLYAEASKSAFWESYSPVELPNYPGDGETECGASCLCEWIFEFENGELKATWLNNDDKPCEGCSQHAEDFNPLVFKLTPEQIQIQDDSGNKYD